MMPSFKDRLEEALEMRGMTAAELSKATGIGEGAISQYRKGAYKASQRNLERISKALRVPIPWLMGLNESDTIEGEKKPTAENDSGPSAATRREFEALLETMSDDDLRLTLALARSIIAERGGKD